jgi:hypothetical protein
MKCHISWNKMVLNTSQKWLQTSLRAFAVQCSRVHMDLRLLRAQTLEYCVEAKRISHYLTFTVYSIWLTKQIRSFITQRVCFGEVSSCITSWEQSTLSNAFCCWTQSHRPGIKGEYEIGSRHFTSVSSCLLYHSSISHIKPLILDSCCIFIM